MITIGWVIIDTYDLQRIFISLITLVETFGFGFNVKRCEICNYTNSCDKTLP